MANNDSFFSIPDIQEEENTGALQTLNMSPLQNKQEAQKPTNKAKKATQKETFGFEEGFNEDQGENTLRGRISASFAKGNQNQVMPQTVDNHQATRTTHNNSERDSQGSLQKLLQRRENRRQSSRLTVPRKLDDSCQVPESMYDNFSDWQETDLERMQSTSLKVLEPEIVSDISDPEILLAINNLQQEIDEVKKENEHLETQVRLFQKARSGSQQLGQKYLKGIQTYNNRLHTQKKNLTEKIARLDRESEELQSKFPTYLKTISSKEPHFRALHSKRLYSEQCKAELPHLKDYIAWMQQSTSNTSQRNGPNGPNNFNNGQNQNQSNSASLQSLIDLSLMEYSVGCLEREGEEADQRYTHRVRQLQARLS